MFFEFIWILSRFVFLLFDFISRNFFWNFFFRFDVTSLSKRSFIHESGYSSGYCSHHKWYRTNHRWWGEHNRCQCVHTAIPHRLRENVPIQNCLGLSRAAVRVEELRGYLWPWRACATFPGLRQWVFGTLYLRPHLLVKQATSLSL